MQRKNTKELLHLFPAMENGWTPKVSICSSQENTGISEIWETISRFNEQMSSSNWKIENRKRQDIYWLPPYDKRRTRKKNI